MNTYHKPKLKALIILGVIGIIVVGNAAGVVLLMSGAGGAAGALIKKGAPVIYALSVLTPLLSAAGAYFAAVLLKRRHDERKETPFDLHDVFSDCRTLITPKAAEKGILLHFYAEPTISKLLLGDPDLLRQALVHLLTNAIRYTNTGMVKIHSAVKEIRDTSITLSFEVKDSGIGMTADQVKKVFASHSYEVRDIVSALGGKLTAHSIPGVGSKFSFELTFKTQDKVEAPVVLETPGKDIDEFEKPLFDGEVLLCEDNVVNQQVICEHLARVGLKTVVAANGKIGVDMVMDRMKKGEPRFDLILMDIHMPVMDGLEAAANISAFNTGIPIVAITANIMPNDLEVYKMSGMYDSVGKPFTSQQLWKCLSAYFKPVKRQTSAEAHFLQVKNKMRQKMAAHFIRDYQNIVAEINTAISAGDIRLAHRLAHTLKGNAGQMEKFLLQQAALEVEQHLRDEKNRVTPQQMAALETELSTALAELAPLAEGGV